MTYREAVPPPWLRAAAERVWRVEPDPDLPAGPVLPDGCMDLVWVGGALIVAGPDTLAQPAPRVPRAATGIRFASGALPALLGVPAAELRDRRVPLADLLPGPARGALARLECGDEPAAVLLDVVRGLPGEPADRAIAGIAAAAARGTPAADIADATGWTPRTLHRHCLAAFGYGPATLRRVLRFRRAMALLRTGMAPADVAATAGYADQPHLSREVRVLGETSPAQASGANRSTPVPSGSRTVA